MAPAVAQDNAPSVPAWNSTALSARTPADSLDTIDFDISDRAALLRTGTNILALHGLNFAATNSDFLLSTELELSSSGTWQTNAGYFFTPTPRQPQQRVARKPRPPSSAPSAMPLPSPSQPTTSPSPAASLKPCPPFSSVVLNWRVMYEPTNRTLTMFDDGAHGDGAPGGRHFRRPHPLQNRLRHQLHLRSDGPVVRHRRRHRQPLLPPPRVYLRGSDRGV